MNKQIVRALLLCAVFLGLMSIVFAEDVCTATGNYAVCTDQADYSPELTVHITGTGFDSMSQLMVKITRPDGSIVTGDGTFGGWPSSYDSVQADIAGNFNFDYVLDGILGTYSIEILDAENNVLATHSFTDKFANGQVCSNNGDCTSSKCVDGVCCESACGGTCEACNQAGRLGYCDPIPGGTDPSNECAQQAVSTCGTNGFCSGSRSCALYASGTVCNAASCSIATYFLADTCNGAGTCIDRGSQSCNPYACGSGVCLTSCSSDSNCNSGFHCDVTTCYANVAAGVACDENSDCSSGYCRTDWDGNHMYCAQDSTSCVYNSGSVVLQRNNQWVECNVGDAYKICTNGIWGALSSECDAATCNSGCGYVTDADNACVSGQGLGVAGGCELGNLGGAGTTCFDCGEFTATAGACNPATLSNCNTACGATCSQGQTTDSGLNVCWADINGNSRNRIDICGISGSDCLWTDNGQTSDTINQDCGLFDCTGAGVCLTTCSQDSDCNTGKYCNCGTNTCQDTAAVEICNGKDDDCDGSIDEGVTTTYYRDADSDGYGNLAVSTQACSQPAGYVLTNTDCNDASAAIHPGAIEIVADGIDENCDGSETCYVDADNDNYRVTGTVVSSDSDCSDSGEALATVPSGDCDDANAAIHPGATEVADDGIDQDCNGFDTKTCIVDGDKDGYGTVAGTIVLAADGSCDTAQGESTSSNDCNDANAAVHPGATEICNRIDDNCNAQVDENDQVAPTTSSNSPTTWQKTSVIVTLTPSDATGCGVQATYYCIDQANTCVPNTLGTSASVSADGISYVRYLSIDTSGFGNGDGYSTYGNVESVKSDVVNIDKTAPVITWNTPVADTYFKNGNIISVDASVTESGSGITDGADCNFDAQGSMTFTGSVNYDEDHGKCLGDITIVSGGGDGARQLRLSVTDIAGNTGQSDHQKIYIDNTAPTTTDNAPTAWRNTDAIVTLSPTDSGSGVANTYYCVYNSGDAACTPTTSGTSVSVTCASGSTCQQIVRYYSVDNLGNAETAHNSGIIKIDKQAPSLNVPADITVEATSSAGAVVTFSASATDLVDPSPSVVCSPVSGSIFAVGDTIVSCTATDALGNFDTKTFKITVEDITPPVITVPSDITLEATGPNTVVNYVPVPSATDIVDGSVTVTCSKESGDNFPVGLTLVTCTATDAHNNTATASFNVTIIDTTPPAIDSHGDETAEATSSSGANVPYIAPTATDLVDGSVTVNCLPVSGSTFALGVTLVTCTATDAHNNTATSSFNVTVQDTTPPTIDNVVDIVTEATGPSGASVTITPPMSHDAVDGDLPSSCDYSTGIFSLGVTTVTCSKTDAAGNVATNETFTVTVQDTTPPAIDPHGDETAEATSSSGASVSYTSPATSDAVDGPSTATCAPASGSTFALGTTTVLCNAVDAHGNHAVQTSFNVTVQDTTPPTIDSHANVGPVEATSSAGAIVSYTSPATSDIVDGAGTASCLPASGSTFALGVTLVTCTATDAHNNTATSSFNVTVQDTTPPTIDSHSDVGPIEATSSAGAIVSYTSPATSDAVDGPNTATCAPASGSTFALGVTTVTCNAQDAAGNNATPTTFNVTVVDTTPPTIDSHGDETAEATGPTGATVSYTSPATSDIVDGAGTASCLPASGSTFALGTTTVLCSAVDAHGNHAVQTSFNVTVQDTTPPTIDSHSDVGPIEATSASGAAVTYTSPATHDIVDGTGTATCAPTSGSTFALGTTTVLCDAVDAHGNHAVQTSFKVTVRDTTPPVIDAHANVGPMEATSSAGAIATYTSPATHDIVDGAGTATCAPVSGSTFALGDTTVTCNAMDAHSNAATPTTFKVTVRDTTPPVIAAHANVIAQATSAAGAVVTYTNPTATDLVDSSVAVTCTPASGSTFAPGETTVNCEATDSHANKATSSFKVNVYYTWTGFFQPVDNPGPLGIFNKANAGSAIPLKFSLGGDMGLNIFAAGSPSSVKTDCTFISLLAGSVETVTAGGSSLQYEPGAKQYIYVWKTEKSWAGTCRLLTVTLRDGTTYKANFKFSK